MDSKFVIDREKSINQSKVTEGFDKYYTNIGKPKADKIPNRDTDPTSLVKHTYTAFIFTCWITPQEVIQLFQQFKKASPGGEPTKVKCNYIYTNLITFERM